MPFYVHRYEDSCDTCYCISVIFTFCNVCPWRYALFICNRFCWQTIVTELRCYFTIAYSLLTSWYILYSSISHATYFKCYWFRNPNILWNKVCFFIICVIYEDREDLEFWAIPIFKRATLYHYRYCYYHKNLNYRWLHIFHVLCCLLWTLHSFGCGFVDKLSIVLMIWIKWFDLSHGRWSDVNNPVDNNTSLLTFSLPKFIFTQARNLLLALNLKWLSAFVISLITWLCNQHRLTLSYAHRYPSDLPRPALIFQMTKYTRSWDPISAWLLKW